MASYSDIQHRFANKLAGKNGCISAGNVRYEGRNFYSYSTVFGQWLDMEKNVVAIFDGSTSTSSSKHKLHKGYFPDGVHVFPLDFGSNSYYGWRNCNLVGEYWSGGGDEHFKDYHRMQMIDHYVDRLYDQFAAINGGTTKGLENVDFTAWDYIEKLCSLYKDTSINKYLKWSTPKKDMNKTQKELINRQRKLVRMLTAGERNVETLTDALFGEGTFKKYWDYCARYRKAADKKAKMLALCERLGIANPYCSDYYGGRWKARLTVEQIRSLTPKERNEIHFASLAELEWNKHENERKKKYEKNFRNAYKWIVGYEPKKKSWGGYKDDVDNGCVNKDTGVVYECSGSHGVFDCFDWTGTVVRFDYDEFRQSENKEQWIAEFYAKCEYAAMLRKAYGIFKRIKAHYMPVSFREKRFVDNDYLRENTTDAEYEVCKDYIERQDKHYADEAARERAAAIERARREEEKIREEEYRKQVRKEQIDACAQRGADGARDMWRLHLTDLHDAEDCCKTEHFYYGGNVLLRMSFNKTYVETSKNIRIPIETCKKMWKIVERWHKKPESFKPMQIDTKGSGTYTISSYENDILTAGCHDISYTEMERMYNEIVSL